MPLPGWQWARREPPDGAKVPHTTGKHDRVNLVIVLGLKSGVTSGQKTGSFKPRGGFNKLLSMHDDWRRYRRPHAALP
jgi:hypothetical protein